MYIVRTLARRFKSLRGMTIVHVGAHKGQEARIYDHWGVSTVVWVEADPAQLPGLEAAIAASQAAPRSWFARITRAPRTTHIVLNALVGDVDGADTPFYLFSNDGMSSSIFMKASDGDDPQPTVNATGEVLNLKMRSLDVLLPEAGIALSDVDVLALDIQGAELLALKGAGTLLKTLRYIETEISKLPFYEGGVLLGELEPWLNACAFYNKTWLRRPFMNAVFIRKG